MSRSPCARIVDRKPTSGIVGRPFAVSYEFPQGYACRQLRKRYRRTEGASRSTLYRPFVPYLKWMTPSRGSTVW